MKEWLEKLNKKIEILASSKWMRHFRIAGGVFWNLTLLTIIFLTASAIFMVSVGAGYFASLVKEEPLRSKEEMREEIFSYEETSELYFANDIYIGKIRTDLDRRETSLANISPNVINAVLATEDEYFREHNGIVPKAVLRGLLQDVSNSSTQTGGSTLTQQLIKNQILTNEVSYERKAKEILLALRLEYFMSKEEILEAYLNIIPYGRNSSGRNIAGIETAAQGIFGIPASELSLPQSAYIAGIPQAPFKYTPFTNKGERKSQEGMQHGIDRMKTVLYRMNEVGYITKKEYEEAIAYDITQDFRDHEERPEDKYPWLTAELEERAKEVFATILAEKDGIDPARLKEESNLHDKYTILADRQIRSGGYRIYSTINKDMYDAMQQVTDEFKLYGQTYKKKVKDPETGEEIEVDVPVQTGSMVIENKTGKILSFVGGRDHELEQLNHATKAYRSNGSTMKPLLAYAPALEYGVIGAGSPVVDVKFKRSYDNYEPVNYNPNQELGIISARQAVASSQNLAVLRLYDDILDKRPATFLEKMGFSKLTEGDFVNLSTAIGGITHGATVEENTNAYATFANNGQFIDAYMIERIEDLDGNVIFEHQTEPVDVFSEETAYMMTDMLRGVLKDGGTATKAKNLLSFSSDFAAKTGTTQDHKDVWLVGYNPNISLGVWLGYDQPRTLYAFNNTYQHPSARVNTLWAKYMNSLYKVDPELIGTKEPFQKPANVVSASFCGISGLAPSTSCANAGLVTSDLFNKSVLYPSKPDDSFISSSSVVINGKSYAALGKTPPEFVKKGGFGLNQAFANRMLGKLGGDASKLLPHSSGNTVVSSSAFKADSVSPSPVSATLGNGVLSWTNSASNDIVGYRVYSLTNGGRSFVASFKSNESHSMKVTPGVRYVVVAVDITGFESSHSNEVGVIIELPPDPEENTNPGDNTEDTIEPTEPEDIEQPVEDTGTN
ncbi:peptidoglycan glycosyltransferase [Solibacillus sp. R5-41]|uniref:transglycosylase domain-containing protein n=1 Tax=Solibacillus sp. R5-41 TaxID=2048654 RepID=UPI000C127D7B|nr:transglycosylase domain-containing protein [Solibacillus sp. R5-41]ATP41462.1 peptidoglycan glycosyltransferase [Solibacillus sp. R5-41]